jgi:hypothetical protein
MQKRLWEQGIVFPKESLVPPIHATLIIMYIDKKIYQNNAIDGAPECRAKCRTNVSRYQMMKLYKNISTVLSLVVFTGLQI